MWTSIVIMILVFAAAFLAVFSVNLVIEDLARRDRKRLRKRLDEETRKNRHARARESMRNKDLGQLAAEASAEAKAESKTLRDRFTTLIEQSGLNLTPRRLLTIMAGSAFVLGTRGGLLSGSLVVGATAASIAAAAPLLFVQFKRSQRLEMLRSQLSDCFDLLSRILRAGQTISQGLQAVAEEFKPPVADEFGLCYEQQNLGLAPELTYRDLARRTGLLEIKIFVLSLLIHRQTGGNLTELLDQLAEIVRERFRLRGMIKSLTAEGRIQAGILLAMPPLMFVVLLFINREYAMKLFDHPVLPITALIFMALGAAWIRKIVNFDF